MNYAPLGLCNIFKQLIFIYSFTYKYLALFNSSGNRYPVTTWSNQFCREVMVPTSNLENQFTQGGNKKTPQPL